MSGDLIAQLDRLARLHATGYLTAEEFAAGKALLLGPSASVGRDAADPDGDLARLLRRVDVLGPPTDWGGQTTYPTVPLALVDSVWSLSVRYQGVLNVIARLRAHAEANGRHLATLGTSEFVSLVDETGGALALADHVSNRQRTSSRNGILKSEAIYREAVILQEEGIERPDDLRSASASKLGLVERRWRHEVPGQGSGLSWTYFLMLLDMPGVKADRMVCRFVAEALGVPERAVTPEFAVELVTAAADALGVDARHLDFTIWNYQRAQGAR